MSYIHCNKCDWEQDDFWQLGGYTPFRRDIIEDLEKSLFKDKIHFDKYFIEEMGLTPLKDEEGYYISGKNYVAYDLLRRAKRILNMRLRTREEWKKARLWFKCPKCGNGDFSED